MEISMTHKVKKYIKLKLAVPKFEEIFCELETKGTHRAILIGSPVHSNLGDHKIAIECKKLIENLGFDEIIEVPEFAYELFPQKIKIADKDTIFICGGGWMGNLYEDELVVEEILHQWRDRRIVILPQTIYFTQNGEVSSIEKLGKFIGEAKNLTVCLREKNSYDFCIKHYPAEKDRFILLPDMALFSMEEQPIHSLKSKLILFSVRDDVESKGNRSLYFRLKQELSEKGYLCQDTSTVIRQKIVRWQDRERIVEAKIQEFSKADLVITDRLHSMIFSLLAGTRCCAMDNVTHKVKGVYETWLTDFPQILFFESVNELDVNSIERFLVKETLPCKTDFRKMFKCLNE